MTTAKLLEKHDYLTVTAVFSKDLRANLTFSRYGMKASGKGLTVPQTRALLEPFDKLRRLWDKKLRPDYKNPGDLMRAVLKMAEQSDTPEAFAAKLVEACK